MENLLLLQECNKRNITFKKAFEISRNAFEISRNAFEISRNVDLQVPAELELVNEFLQV